MNPRRLYRSNDDRMVAGVCGGVAAYFDVDPVIVRIVWFLSFFFTGSLTFWAYLIMAIVVPVEPDVWPPASPWAPGGAPIDYSSPGSVGGAAPISGDPGPAAGSPDAAAPTGTSPAVGGALFAAGAPFVAGAPGGAWPGDWRSQRRQERWDRRQLRRQQRHERRANRDRTPGLVFGLLLILVGGLLAWNQVDPSFDLAVTWPVVVIALGAVLVISAIRPRGNGDGGQG